VTDQIGRSDAISLLDRLRAEHERYKDLVTFLPIDKSRLQEDSRRYLCLRCAGFLEQMVYLTVRHYLSKKTSGPALEFSTSYFKQAPNLTPSALRSVFARFGADDLAAVNEFIDDSRHDVLSDLLSIRNLVAHGEGIGGAKLDPTRYIELCEEFHSWCVGRYMSE